MNLTALPPRANLRPKEVAAFLSIGLSMVYEMLENEDLPSIRVGRILRIPKDDFVQWLRRNSRGQLELF